jgi:hypothetical protein
VHKPVELVVKLEGVRTRRQRRSNAILTGRSQAQVNVRGIIDGPIAIQDAQEAEHGRMRGITNTLHDHLLVADRQLAEPQAQGASPRVRVRGQAAPP